MQTYNLPDIYSDYEPSFQYRKMIEEYDTPRSDIPFFVFNGVWKLNWHKHGLAKGTYVVLLSAGKCILAPVNSWQKTGRNQYYAKILAENGQIEWISIGTTNVFTSGNIFPSEVEEWKQMWTNFKVIFERV